MRLTLIVSSALTLILCSTGFGQIVEFRFEAIDGALKPISQVQVDEEFTLNVYAQDKRGLDEGGVFAAYLDLGFDTTMVALDGPITYGDNYHDFQTVTLSESGLINAGALGSLLGADNTPTLQPLGADEYMVFSVPMVGTKAGNLSFVGGPASDQIQHQVLLYGGMDGVSPTDIEFGSLAPFSVVPEPSAASLLLLGLLVLGRRVRR